MWLSKNKFFVCVLVIALPLVFLAIYFYYQLAGKQEITKPVKTEVETELQLQEQAGEIIKTKDFKRCDEIKDETYQIVCVNNIALNLAEETQDISYCQKIDNTLVSIEGCERQVIFKKSLGDEDIGVCGETQNQKIQKECQDGFWLKLALKKDNATLCNNHQAEQEINYCRDSYVFQKEFIQNLTNFSCEKFADKQVEADCIVYKKNLDKNTDRTGSMICRSLKSDLFLNYCLLNNLRL